METEIINNKEYRLVELRGRKKLIAKDGDAINPYKRNQKATIHINPDGYPCFGGGVPVHLYVATAWVDGWFEGAEVDHIDYDRMNYSWDNLRWVTHQDNIDHSHIDIDHYTGRRSGEKNGRSVFSKNDVKRIRGMYDSGMSTMDIIKHEYPEKNFDERKALWNRYNRIKTGETWSE